MAKFSKALYPLLLLALWLVAFVEYFNRSSATGTLTWLLDFNVLFLNFLIVLSFLLLGIAITGRTRWGYWLIGVILLILAIASGIKFKIMGVPILPWDLFLSSEATNVLPYVSSILDWKTLGAFAVFLLGSYLMVHKLPHFNFKFNWITRGVFALLTVLIITGIYTDKPFPLKQKLDVRFITWDQASSYLQNGFMLTSVENMKLIFIDEPTEYNRAMIEQIIANTESKTELNPVDPNVIVILWEAFWDPTIMEDVRFNEDPIPFYHSLQEEYTHGWMRTPSFGGGTANVEYEILTGNTMRFHAQGSLPFIQYINGPVDSLASILGRQGYEPIAINTYHNWFFNASTVYKNMGFSRFVSSEYFNPVYSGPFLADDELANVIIRETEQADSPSFIFAKTMENHYPFDPWKFGGNDFKVEGANLSDEAKGYLETLAQGIHSGDQMLKKLVEYYTESGEPTLILIFGDHLPVLGDDYLAFREGNFIKDGDPDTWDKLYSTPFLIWNNYLSDYEIEVDKLNASFLPAYLLHMIGKEGNYYTDFLYSFYEKTPQLPGAESGEFQAEMKAYELLQYDILFGNQYGYNGYKDQIINPNYVLGFGPMAVDSITSQSSPEDEEMVVKLEGQNFVPEANVYLDNQALETTFIDHETLTATLPASQYNRSRTKQFDVRVIDTKNVTITETNKLTLELDE
ncbi:sulfatase-like hydrolase/transferase [Paenibacillus senegalensis]|uniref:sulfatase-like hydrolase/transferase n=1 Tax=Paenibacillus senegalensis TaxID=1465766 RepID=UPI00028A0A3B|nr:sulfatase-like hydrolase/transferase [Paenibacillus senegalensis]